MPRKLRSCPSRTCSGAALELAFDHRRIVDDAVARVRLDLELTGIATAFVGPTFTLAELRRVYEAVWDVRLDAANFRRHVAAEDGWVVPTGQRCRRVPPVADPPSCTGPDAAWRRQAPIHRRQRRETLHDDHARCGPRPIRFAGRPAPRDGGTTGAGRGRGPHPHPRDDRQSDRLRLPAGHARHRACVQRLAPSRFRILGNELAGVVEGIGSDVTGFAVGDRVFGVDQRTFGANAEYTCMRQDGPLATMPDGMTFADGAAMCDGFILAMTCLRGADLQRGQRILIYGATGSIGTAGVQLAHDMGAHVTAVADTRNLELVRSLGADEVIDRFDATTSAATARPMTWCSTPSASPTSATAAGPSRHAAGTSRRTWAASGTTHRSSC